MWLLPGAFWLSRLARQVVDRVMEPVMPFRRRARGFGFALIEDPAALATEASPAFLQGRARLVAVIAIAELVAAHQLAAKPRHQPRAEGHARQSAAPTRTSMAPIFSI